MDEVDSLPFNRAKEATNQSISLGNKKKETKSFPFQCAQPPQGTTHNKQPNQRPVEYHSYYR
jgi:hypothetical protein